jgi:hypothetical protein
LLSRRRLLFPSATQKSRRSTVNRRAFRKISVVEADFAARPFLNDALDSHGRFESTTPRFFPFTARLTFRPVRIPRRRLDYRAALRRTPTF